MATSLLGYGKLSAVKNQLNIPVSKKRKKRKLSEFEIAFRDARKAGKDTFKFSVPSSEKAGPRSYSKKTKVEKVFTTKLASGNNKKNTTTTSTPKQNKLIGGKGWGLTKEAQKKLPKSLQKIGVGQTEKTVTIMGKKLTFKAPDPSKKRKAWHGGWVYD
jgi:hypothetical protein